MTIEGPRKNDPIYIIYINGERCTIMPIYVLPRAGETGSEIGGWSIGIWEVRNNSGELIASAPTRDEVMNEIEGKVL